MTDSSEPPVPSFRIRHGPHGSAKTGQKKVTSGTRGADLPRRTSPTTYRPVVSSTSESWSIAPCASKTFAKRSGYTHFVKAEGRFLEFYSQDSCEVCGDLVQAANPIKVVATPHEALSAGLQEGLREDDWVLR